MLRSRRLAVTAGMLTVLAAGGVAVASSPEPATTPVSTVPGETSPPTAAGETTVPAETTAPPAPCAPPPTDPGATASSSVAPESSTVAPTTAPPTTAPPTTPAPTTVAETPSAGTAGGALDIPLPGVSTPASVEAPGSTVPVDQLIVLGRDGLGVARFCDDAEVTLAAMTALIGPADDDSGWVDPFTISACPGTLVRRVTWGSLDLYFGDESRFASGRQHFFGFSYGNIDGFDVAPPGLATPEGVGLGTPVAYLRATYPGVSIIPGEEGIQEPTFYVDENLRGLLTDDSDEGVITLMIGGEACGV